MTAGRRRLPKDELYPLVAELHAYGVGPRESGELLGISGSYVCNMLAEMGLNGPRSIPSDLKRRCERFRTTYTKPRQAIGLQA